MRFKSFSIYIPGIVALVVLVVGFVVANAFTSPTQAPPGGNVPAPLNAGPASQTKEGNLALNTSNLFLNGLLVPFGNVGIGVAIPEAALEVINAIRITPRTTDPFGCAASKKGSMYFNSTSNKHMLCNGSAWVDYTGPQGVTGATGATGPVGPPGPSTGIASNVTPDADNIRDLGTPSLRWKNLNVVKLTVGTIDPVYEIGGKKYATYVADVAGGVKTEVTGKFEIRSSKFEIDFDTQQVGSDLWLFWETSNKSVADIVVLLTPGFDGKAWYEKKPTKNQIIIYASQDGEVSFRFTAPRKDAAQWPNEIKD